MNIRKLEDLSKDELIELIKHEREGCDQLVPISVDECLPKAIGESEPWSDEVIAYGNNDFDIAFYSYEYSGWFSHRELITGVTHWLPIPRLTQ